MKNKTLKSVFVLLIFSSCSSIYRFSIDVQEPAKVTLPVSAQNVLILNNSVTQPKDFGIERMLNGQSIGTNFPLSLDTMVWSAVEEISAVLNESNFFKSIAVYRAPLRKDKEWLARVDLSPEVQSDFYGTENFDALLVVNRLLFSVKENAKIIQTGAFTTEPLAFVDMRIDGILSCSMYAYGKEKPLISFSVSDSLFVKYTVTNDSTILFKEIPEFVLDALSRRLGNQAANYFIPTWKTSERQIFTAYNSRMQEATGYAANRQWANAESVWIAEFGRKTNPVDKAKIAYNLAIATEMQDKFDSAWSWVQKAKDCLKEAGFDNHSQEMQLIDKYTSELELRIQNDRLLDLQWGKE